MWRRRIRALRAGLAMAVGYLAYPMAWLGLGRPRDALADAVATMLLIGFYGATTRSPSARLLARQVRRGEVGGVFFVHQNIGTRDQAAALVESFRAAPLLAIDHEGGIVQRLTGTHGFTWLPAARDVAATMTPEAARTLYARAGRELAEFGFTVNLGPVVDFDHPDNRAIGIFGRAYGIDPAQITAYGAAFVDGFAAENVVCVLKHFPGHGCSVGDSHDGIADISGSWTPSELEPFARLIAAGRAPIVMGGHVRLDTIEPEGLPATISPAIITGLLRRQLGYKGVVMTDDLDMDAVSHVFGRRQAFIHAIRAGNDLLMIKNLFRYDPLLPQRAVGWVRAAIRAGILREAQIIDAAERVRKLRLDQSTDEILSSKISICQSS